MAKPEAMKVERPVHFAVTLVVREGMEAEFAEKLTRFAQRSLDYRGTTGVHLIHPVPGTGSREFGVLRSFVSERHSREFYQSDLYQQYKQETAHLVEGEPMMRPLDGLEAFFKTGGRAVPPRWKMALVTYLAVVPSALFWSAILRPLFRDFNWTVAVVVGNAAVVVTLAWAMMPLLTTLFQPWLHPIEPGQPLHAKTAE